MYKYFNNWLSGGRVPLWFVALANFFSRNSPIMAVIWGYNCDIIEHGLGKGCAQSFLGSCCKPAQQITTSFLSSCFRLLCLTLVQAPVDTSHHFIFSLFPLPGILHQIWTYQPLTKKLWEFPIASKNTKGRVFLVLEYIAMSSLHPEHSSQADTVLKPPEGQDPPTDSLDILPLFFFSTTFHHFSCFKYSPILE